MKKSKILVGLLIATTAVASVVMSSTVSADEYFTIKNGELERPTGYREWVYVGTPVTPNDMNDGKAPFPEFHNVYIDPKSWKHWKETGKFPEDTILVKELVTVGSKAAASGKGYFMGDFTGLEATIKSKRLYPKEPGNWAYFRFTIPPEHNKLHARTKAAPTKSCNTCHEVNPTDDFVFTQYYPVLRAAKGNPKKTGGGEL